MSITKTDLYQAIADETQLPRQKSTQTLTTILNAMTDALAAGDEVRIGGFGKFHVKTLAARSGRHPRNGSKIEIASRRSVGFKCFKHLKDRLNPATATESPADAAKPSRPERRKEHREENLILGHACVRISGIPVCEFPVKDVSGNGSCILVKAKSMIMRNIRIGQEIEIHMPSAAGNHRTFLQRSRITHITRQEEQDRYPGYVMVGVQVIDRLPSNS